MKENKQSTAIYVAFDEIEPSDQSTPEKNLLRAILITAMADLSKSGEERARAHEYFLSPDEEYIFAFRTVCSMLDIDYRTILILTGLMEPEVERTRGRKKSRANPVATDPDPQSEGS